MYNLATLRLIIIGLIFILVCHLPSIAQKKPIETTLFALGKTDFSRQEFNYYFLKNATALTADSAKLKVKQYLDLYVIFKLKVLDALTNSRDKHPAFIQEFEGYKKQLIVPYLMQTRVNQQMVKDTYQRLKKEVSASHILIHVDESANPEDTLIAYQKAYKIKQRILKGEDFDALAVAESEDPSAITNKGYLGYFSALQMVFPIENAVFGNQPGDIVGPVKTQFGYHLIAVKDQRPARGQLLTAHIMVKTHQDDSAGIALAEKKAKIIYANLKAGKEWIQQCSLYSEDSLSKSHGGQINWFGTGGMTPSPYKEAAFALRNKGDFSQPIQTHLGWHIIKLIDKKRLPPFEEIQTDLEKKISRDGRSKVKQSITILNLKKSQNFVAYNQVKQLAFATIDSTLLQGIWQPRTNKSSSKKIIFTTNHQNYSVQEFLSFVQKIQGVRKVTELSEYKSQLYNQFEEKCILDEELKNIANNHDYAKVLNEYRSGILLFNMMEEKVWKKAVNDSLGLQTYYNSNVKNYPLVAHAVVRKFVSTDSTLLMQVKENLNYTNSQLDSIYNAKEPLALRASEETIDRNTNNFIDQHWQVGNHLQEEDEYYTLYSIVELKPKGYKPLEMIKGLVISDYQTKLEKQWVASLKKKYPLKVNKLVLQNLIESFED